MAMYGLNFNRTEIPPGVKKKFAQRVTVTRGVKGTLQGVAQSPEERDLMLTQATNGRRNLHVETRKTPAGPWFGIYVY